MDSGHRRPQKKVQLACHAQQSLGQGESLWVQCPCPKITSECSLHSSQAEEEGTGLLWAPNSRRSHSCKLHFLLSSSDYSLPRKLISINPLLSRASIFFQGIEHGKFTQSSEFLRVRGFPLIRHSNTKFYNSCISLLNLDKGLLLLSVR